MTTNQVPEELKQQAIIEALEFYIYQMKKDNCNEAAIDLFTQVLKEINPNDD
jgi:hypothetical protein